MSFGARHLGVAKRFDDIANGDLYVLESLPFVYLAMRVNHSSTEYDLLLCDLREDDKAEFPHLICAGTICPRFVRHLAGEFKIAPIGDNLGADYAGANGDSLASGDIGLTQSGGPILYTRDTNRMVRLFDLSTGLGVAQPNPVAWQKSWRLLWIDDEKSIELMRRALPA